MVVYLICGNMRDMKMTDFPTYPWETLDVYQENCYCYNIRPGQHVVGEEDENKVDKEA